MLLACLGFYFATYYEDSLQENRLLILVMITPAHNAADQSILFQRTHASARAELPLARFMVCDQSGSGVWRNYAHNRQLCLQQASQPDVLEEYVLVVDPGQVLTRVGRHARITADYGTVRMRNAVDYTDAVALLSVRLLRMHVCQYHGWAGEYLDCRSPASASTQHYASLELFDPDADKFTAVEAQKLMLLKRSLTTNNTARTHFYVAQLYERKGDLREANKHYVYQLEAGEHHENYRYYAHYARARLAVRIGVDASEARQLFLATLDSGTEGLMRWEPRYYLARMERAAKRYNRCILYASVDYTDAARESRLADLLPLHVEYTIYAWALQEELGYCLWFAGQRKEAEWHLRRVAIAKQE